MKEKSEQLSCADIKALSNKNDIDTVMTFEILLTFLGIPTFINDEENNLN